jgi:hypothetical protein
LRAGDRVVRRTPDHFTVPASVPLVLDVARDGRPLTFVLHLERDPWSPLGTLVQIALVVVAALAIAATIALTVQRPSWATAFLSAASINLIFVVDPVNFWGQYLTFAGTESAQPFILFAVVYAPVWFLVLFALAFPRAMWTRTRAVSVIVMIALAAFVAFDGVPDWMNNAAAVAPYAAAIAIFALSYARAEPSVQRRLTWLMIALAIYLACQVLIVVFAISASLGSHGLAVRILDLLSAIAWFPIVYAVWRRHVVGVAFAVNRSLVVAGITAAVLGIASLARWIGEHFLVQTGLAGYLAIAVTVLFGYGLNAFAHRIQATVERFVFRQRYAAEQRLLRTIGALPFAMSRDAVAEAVVDDACEELQLTSAALFLPAGERYERARKRNWPDGTTRAIDADDRMLRVLQAEGKLLVLRELAVRRSDFPAGESEPIYALPFLWRGQLTGFVLYGRHRNGSQLDPQELALLQRLVSAATIAYETAELGELRRRVAMLERRLLAL